MKVNNTSDISFKSNIKFVDVNTFKNMVKSLNPKIHEVRWPWSADTMKTGKNLYTTDILDCIAGGIVDNSKVTMFHLGIYNQAKAKLKHQSGFDIENVRRRILEKIDLANENLHGIILGGFQLSPNSKYNINQLNKIRKIFDENKIPYSIFGARKDVHYFGKYSLFYSNKQDTWYITNSLACGEYRGIKPEIEIKDGLISYNKYYQQKDIFGGTDYIKVKKESTFINFLKNQFREVKISKFDNII